MVTPSPAGWTARSATFALWLLAAGSAALWVLKVNAPPAAVAANVGGPRPVAAVDPAGIARLLGATAAPVGSPVAIAAPALSSRFSLLGVAAGAVSGGGAAVIAVDGKPARPYRVGAQVDEGLVLQSVHGRRAVLAATPAGPAVLTLELPPLRK